MVATKAFGMGIDKANIRHVIRNGVPESVVSWAQELGRAGRDGKPATATVIYRKSDIRHANAWIWNNLQNRERCKKILSDFSTSWQYVEAHLAGVCRRKLLLQLFGEDNKTADCNVTCCNVCATPKDKLQDFLPELKVLVDALDQVGMKGEVKVAEWIRASSISWTNAHNKKAFSYGNHRGYDLVQWRRFIRQCHVLGLIKYELKSMIKGNGHYSVMGVFYPLEKARCYIAENHPLLLPSVKSTVQESTSHRPHHSLDSAGSDSQKRKREGKGSNILPVARKLLQDQENWKQVSSKQDYHFLGSFSKLTEQQLYYIPDCNQLQQSSTSNPHFLWSDMQLSKGKLNKDRLIEVEIGNKKEKVFYHSAPCLGVKVCSEPGCSHVAPIRERRACVKHPNQKMVRTDECPVEFIYIYPQSYHDDHRRWIGGIVRNQKQPETNLHNHPLHPAFKMCNFVKDKIHAAVTSNPILTPTDVTHGKGIGFIPSAVDTASSHLGKVAREVVKAKESLGIRCKEWSPTEFEKEADKIDENDFSISDDTTENKQRYKKYGRPYLVSTGFENQTNYICTISPLMAKVATNAEFIQTDITYDENSDYRYLFNVVAFNDVTMEWMVVGRVRLDKQDSAAYRLAFTKFFETCKHHDSKFELNQTLVGIITDWSDAEINGLKEAVGKEVAENLLKGCKVAFMSAGCRSSCFT